MYENFKHSPLVNLRSYIRRILYEIAGNSANSSSRQKALSCTFDIYDKSIFPKLDNLWLKDFNDEIKQKILKLISHQYTKKDLLFYSESIVRQDMITF
jgi:trans-2-enoyl-CoA reductase